MTIVLQSIQVEGITIQKYFEKFNKIPFWRVIKGGQYIKTMLRNKPNKKQINGYLTNY